MENKDNRNNKVCSEKLKMKNRIRILFILLSVLFMNSSIMNAQTWDSLGSGLLNSPVASCHCNNEGIAQVNALTVYNGNLYAAGHFNTAGAGTDSCIAMWTGTGWGAPLSTGIGGLSFTGSSSVQPGVNTLAVYNGNLYAGGRFTTAGGISVNNIAMWNGSSWTEVGSGTNGAVLSLAVYNGSLFVGGNFSKAGGLNTPGIAQWNGSSWSQVGSGINLESVEYAGVQSLTVYNGNLIAAGAFNKAGGIPVNNIAQWNGSNWSGLGTGITRKDTLGSSFSNFMDTVYVFSLAVYNGNLIAGGAFLNAGGILTNNIAQWNGSNWSSVGSGVNNMNGLEKAAVYSLAVYHGNLYAGGNFYNAGGINVRNIAIWNGVNWTSPGIGIPTYTGKDSLPFNSRYVASLCVFNGSLIAGGFFNNIIGGNPNNSIGAWNDTISNVLTVSVNPGDTAICAGQNIQLAATGYGGTQPYFYTWSPAAGLNSTSILNPIASPIVTTTYTVTITDLKGATATSVTTVSIGQNCANVWPGDADENGIANNYDMLALGLGYGNTGSARTQPSINWVGQAATNWTNSLPGLGTNDKFADCNGDGTIDFNDTTAIVQNYGLTHSLRLRQANNVAGLPELYFTFPSDTILAGTSIQVPIGLGSTNNPMNGVYGIAFSINYDPTIVDTTKIGLAINPSWLGTNGTNLLYITRNFGTAGQLEVGITRIDHQTISGSGTIGTLGISMKDDLLLRMKANYYATLNISATQVRVINNKDSVLAINTVSNSAVVSQLNVNAGINNLNLGSGIKVYPNPASGSFTVDLNQNQGQVKEMDLFNIIGEKIWQQNTGFNDRVTIDTQSLAAGTYYLSVLTNQGKVVKQVNVIR